VYAVKKWIVIVVLVLGLVALVSLVSLEKSPIIVDAEPAGEPRKEASGRNAQPSQPKILRVDQSEHDTAQETAITINWRQSPYRDFPFPNGSPLENYHYYKSLAESGNGFAAYQLAEMMRNCSHTFLTRDELNAAKVQIRETFTFIDPERNVEVRIGEPADVDRYIENAIQRFENCSDFTVEQRQEHGKWMELAANNGYALAMIDYGNKLDDPEASVALYRAAWREGNGDALLSLAEGLERTYNQGIDPTAKVPAYAAMHAFVTLLTEAHGAGPERVVGRWTLRNQAKLDEMAKELLPSELETAVELSKQLITSNRNCCFEM
jgi:hypothetical protein